MNRLVSWLEDYILPFANRLAQVRWLVALRDAFISIMPITFAGSIAVLIKSLVEASKTHLDWKIFAFIMQPVVAISNVVWRGTFSLFALFLAFSLGYHLAKSLETNRLAGAIVSLASFTMSVANFTKLRVNGKNFFVHNAFDISQFSTTGIFTAILFGTIGVAIYVACYKARIIIHLSTSLPHAEQSAFDSLAPGIIAIFSVGAINYIFQLATGTYFGNWLLHSIQVPLVKMGQGFGMILLVTLLVQVFWFFGINGLGVLSPILDSIWLTAQNVNVTAARDSRIPPFLWVRGSFDVFAWFGGAGGTLMLIVAILLFSKRSDYRTIAKVALAPGIFNINEPIVLGLPVVLNPVYFIPFVTAPLVNVVFSYLVSMMGLVNPVQVAVPSIMPPIIGPFLACNYDWRAIVLSLIDMLISLAIWTPFVFAADKIADANNSRSFFTTQY
ncbi:PTS system cellobiose-specific IIC component [Lactobacillus acetotolerans]|uniref:Permease IIC component n=1 Tax=Lactobacillus acetotolerans TaxID=1600 RepID=A0A0D6A4D1_9LACO|nr:PTS transporter subunit EIIC [Lactobacillus acetotolerans]BAQ57626.1 PTS system cellobiose-specific IIC component [Lactobacillus acetotolerans]